MLGLGILARSHWDNILVNGKENGNYYSMLGLYRVNNGKENENYYSISGGILARSLVQIPGQGVGLGVYLSPGCL